MAELTVDPHMAICITILFRVKVYLATVVALFIVLETLHAVLAVDHLHFEVLEPLLSELGLLLRLRALFLQSFRDRGLRSALCETSLLISS